MIQASSARRLRVGLLWHSPNSGNLGVGALTVANIAILQQVARELGVELDLMIVGMRDDGEAYVAESDARTFTVDTRSLLSPAGAWRVLGQQDCVLDIGAGDSFADIYGPKRFAFLWLTKLMCLVRGTPLLLSPQTIGPFSRQPYVSLARFALARARSVVVRDTASLDFLRTLAPKAKGVLSVDVAFALPYQDSRRKLAPGAPVRVGVNVSGLLFGEAEAGSNRFGLQVDYAELMRRFIADLAARPEVEVHLLTHANGRKGDADDDGWAIDKLAAEFPSAVRIPDFTSPSDAKSYISGLDFLVAGRMHACIAAYSSGTPVIPVAYSRKFSGLFGMLGYRWTVPVTGMSTEQALSHLHQGLAQRETLLAEARQGLTKVDALLNNYRNELRALFTSVKATL